MSRYLKIALVSIYVLLTILCCLLILILSGIHISSLTGWLIVAAWVLYCFGSAWLFTDLWLFTAPTRHPIRAEEGRLVSALKTVRRNTGYHKHIRLLVLESDDWEAFAIGIRTIVVSKAMLRDLPPNELEGVIAHELGHLIDRDPLIATAYVQARLLTHVITNILRWTFRILTFGFSKPTIVVNGSSIQLVRPSLSHGIIWLVLFGILIHYLGLKYALVALILYAALFSLLNKIFHFFDLLLSRMTEYRQDAYAQQMGFGKDLRDALEKLAQKGEQPVSPYFIIFHSTHPVIYNRIRRLEQLENAEDQRRMVKTKPTP